MNRSIAFESYSGPREVAFGEDSLVETLKELFRRSSSEQPISRKPKKYKYKIFISYVHSEAGEVVDRLCKTFEEEGIDVFQDRRELSGGDSLTSEIREAIIQSERIGVVFSASAMKSKWVIKESAAAWILNKHVIPLLHGTRAESLPSEFSDNLSIDVTNTDEILEYLRRELPPKRTNEKSLGSVKLIDTFFSRFPAFRESVRYAKEESSSVKVLALDPTCQQAKDRANRLRNNSSYRTDLAVYRLNLGLLKMREALRRMDGMSFDEGEMEGIAPSEFLAWQLTDILELGSRLNFELKFYNSFATTPVYIVGDFAVFGILSQDSSPASEAPHTIYVNDETQRDDVYDALSQNFDQIWERAISINEMLGKINRSSDSEEAS